MSWGVEDEQRRKGILELMKLSEEIVRANPNHVNEVNKSRNGCWMEQMYGMMRCDFCDLSQDCPVREEHEWQEYLRTNNIIIVTDSDNNS